MTVSDRVNMWLVAIIISFGLYFALPTPTKSDLQWCGQVYSEAYCELELTR